MSSSIKGLTIAATAFAVASVSPAHAILDTTFTAVGPDPASIQGTVDALGALVSQKVDGLVP